MGRDGFRETLEVVAALEQRHDTPAGAAARDVEKLRGRPGEVGLLEVQVGERVAPVRVEAGRYDDKVGPKRLDARKQAGLEGVPEYLPVRTGRQRGIDDGVVIAPLRARPGAGVERHLMRRAVEDGGVAPEDVL